MLEGLDAIEWSQLGTSRGSSGEEIPAYFRALASDDPSARKTACAALDDLLNH